MAGPFVAAPRGVVVPKPPQFTPPPVLRPGLDLGSMPFRSVCFSCPITWGYLTFGPLRRSGGFSLSALEVLAIYDPRSLQ